MTKRKTQYIRDDALTKKGPALNKSFKPHTPQLDIYCLKTNFDTLETNAEWNFFSFFCDCKQKEFCLQFTIGFFFWQNFSDNSVQTRFPTTTLIQRWEKEFSLEFTFSFLLVARLSRQLYANKISNPNPNFRDGEFWHPPETTSQVTMRTIQ